MLLTITIDPTTFIIYVAVAIVALLLLSWYLRAVHNIQKRDRLMRAQIDLLAKIAKQQGVPPDEIDGVLNTTKDQSVI